MSEPKTRPTSETLASYLSRVADPERRKDCATLAALMQKVTGQPATIWGPEIVGFGKYRYKYANGKELDWPVTGFASRKNDLTLYVLPDASDAPPDLMARLGKYKRSKVCVYIKRLSDVDMPTLTQLIERGVEFMKPQRVE